MAHFRLFVACILQHSWRGLAGLSPSACSEGSLLCEEKGGGTEGRRGEGGGGRGEMNQFWTKNACCRILRQLQSWGEARVSRGHGQAGLGHPPWEWGGGFATSEQVCKRGVGGCF